MAKKNDDTPHIITDDRGDAEKWSESEIPKIARSKALEKWIDADLYRWTSFGTHCESCGARYETGDITFAFGRVEDAAPEGEMPAAVKIDARNTCTQCAWAILQAGVKFTGMGVHIDAVYRGFDIDDLPAQVRGRIVEAFTLVDQLIANLDRAIREEGERNPA